jgi:DNA-binding transcriptional LysR family regulator
MDTRVLRNFLVVAEQLHFGHASELIGTSQPALSQQIRALETSLGVELFERAQRRVRLTAAGAIYRTDVPHIISAFRAAYPDVGLRMRIMRSSDLFEALNAREIHVGFTRVPAGEPAIVADVMWSYPYRVILPAAHPLARNAEIDLSDLNNETLISYRRASIPESYDQIIAMCHALGFDPKRFEEVPGIESAVGLIACGFGVALFPTPWERTFALPEVTFRPIARADAWRFRIAMSRHRDERSSLTQSFVDLALSLGLSGNDG